MEGIAMALWNLTIMAATMGNFESAFQTARESMGVKRTIYNTGQEVNVIHDLAWVNFMSDNLPEARQLVETALKEGRKTMDQKSIALALLFLGNVACFEGRVEEGKQLFEECLNITKTSEEGMWVEIMTGLGHVAFLQGEYGGAARLYRQSLEKKKLILPALPALYEKLAYILQHQSQPVRAAMLLGAADNLRRTMGLLIPPVEQGEYDECLALLSSQLDKAEKNKLWNAGAAMSIEESTAFGLVE